ncbi:MAG: RNA-binding protein [archaeon]|nr:RNA-binding protein [archaeon]
MIHNIRFREFVYKDENQEELTQAILNIFPNAEVEVEEAEGMMEDKILILTGLIKKKRHTRDVMKRLLSSDQVSKLEEDLDRKMDEKGNLFLRLSKKAAIDDELKIVDSGDSIHLKVKIAAFPAKKDVAMKLIQEAINA